MTKKRCLSCSNKCRRQTRCYCNNVLRNYVQTSEEISIPYIGVISNLYTHTDTNTNIYIYIYIYIYIECLIQGYSGGICNNLGMIVCVILSKKFPMKMGQILNGYRDMVKRSYGPSCEHEQQIRNK